MTWLGWSFLVVMFLPALYIACVLHQERKAERAYFQKMKLDAECALSSAYAYEAEAKYLYEKAADVYRDAAARWSSLVRLEGRIH